MHMSVRPLGPCSFAVLCLALSADAQPTAKVYAIDPSREIRAVRPLVGFLGGLRDATPDSIVRPLQPNAWRVGWQYQDRIGGGLRGAVAKVEGLGAQYKLVMSDLIGFRPTAEQVQGLVLQAGDKAATILWEPDNEPDVNLKPDTAYFRTYVATFKALRAALPGAQAAGPGYAFPSLEKYRAFLDYCKLHGAEVNVLTWHYTGWDPHEPERMGWKLGELRDLIGRYPELRIKEIHCDEWGAGPEVAGRLHPGRALLWFHYLENVYRLDRAGRANWGGDDDWLGGIVDRSHRPYPVWHAYRWYGETAGQTRVEALGGDPEGAALASKASGRLEILVGSIAAARPVALEIKGLALQADQVEVRRIPATGLEAAAAPAPETAAFTLSAGPGGTRVLLASVAAQEAYRVVIRHPGIQGSTGLGLRPAHRAAPETFRLLRGGRYRPDGRAILAR